MKSYYPFAPSTFLSLFELVSLSGPLTTMILYLSLFFALSPIYSISMRMLRSTPQRNSKIFCFCASVFLYYQNIVYLLQILNRASLEFNPKYNFFSEGERVLSLFDGWIEIGKGMISAIVSYRISESPLDVE